VLIAMLPVLALLISQGGLSQALGGFGGLDPQARVVAMAVLAAGFFIWPMLVLVVAVGSFGGLLRPDLMVATIIKSFPAYLATVLAVYISLGLQIAVRYAADQAKPDWDDVAQWLMVMIVLPAAMRLLGVYVTIFSMRAIGLYYHNFKHKFAWGWG
jgi:hypothetical protein